MQNQDIDQQMIEEAQFDDQRSHCSVSCVSQLNQQIKDFETDCGSEGGSPEYIDEDIDGLSQFKLHFDDLLTEEECESTFGSESTNMSRIA